jgi:Tfp pilus assembly protein PilF
MCLPLKVMSRIIVWALMASFLTVGLTFCQNRAERSFTKGVMYAAEGDFERAKEEFEKALKVDPTHELAERFLMIIEDINEAMD